MRDFFVKFGNGILEGELRVFTSCTQAGTTVQRDNETEN